MSKIKPEKINFDDDDFVVEVNNEDKHKEYKEDSNLYQTISDENSEIEKITEQAKLIIQNANREKETIIKGAKKQSEEIINSANNEAKEIINNANKESLELLENSKTELEKQITESAKEGYSAGYNDGLEKVKEELSEKIENFDKFCNIQSEIKNKILKSASKELLNIITNIAKKILLFEVNPESVEKIINTSINMLEKKENINIILSEKYAKMLFELQNNKLTEEYDFSFKDFKQYENFNIIYNSKFDDDTIIVENMEERFDASISSQLNVLVRNIFEQTQNGKIDNIEKIMEQSENES